MPRDVIMPALGMAQSTGVIVSWLKSVGDAVKADDPLMEVETDKTTMEVDAGFEGFLVEIRAEAGAEIPVGDVVAVIGDAPSAGAKPAAKTGAPTSPSASAADVDPPAPPPVAPGPAASRSSAADGGATRVLASPKARMLAATRGIDLAPHAARSQTRPILTADVEAMTATPVAPQAQRPAEAAQVTAPAPRAVLKAAARTAGWTEFRQWLAGAVETPVSDLAVVAAFAAGALRRAAGVSGPIVVSAESLAEDGTDIQLADPDRSGLAALASAGRADGHADLAIVDLTGTALTGAEGLGPPSGLLLVMSQGSREGAMDLSLTFDPAALAPRAAAALLTDIARRIETPLRHLL